MIKRVITAVILMPLVVVGLLYLPQIVVNIVLSLVILLAAWEFFALFDAAKKIRAIFIAILALLELVFESVGSISITWIDSKFITQLVYSSLLMFVVIGVLWWLIAPYFLWRYEKTGRQLSISPLLLGVMIFIPCWAGFILLSEPYRVPLLILLSIVWAADIGAYFVGNLVGKHSLTPRISPKKTIEGVGGGILASLLVATIWLCFLNHSKMIPSGVISIILLIPLSYGKMVSALIISIIVALWSVVGDLFESMLKRQAGVKDSGKLLPGHGGMYDRIDGLIAATPIFFVGVLIVGLIGLLFHSGI